MVYHCIEFAENGSLSNVLRYTGPVAESQASFMFLQLADAVANVHRSGFAHLDLKLENILLDQFFNLKLADFGSAVHLPESPHFFYRKGTAGYMAPEVESLQEGDSFDAFKADMFSLGMCLQHLLFATASKDDQGSRDSNTSTGSEPAEGMGEWLPHLTEMAVSPECADLLGRLLSKDRPSIEEVLDHPWLANGTRPGIEQEVYTEMVNRKRFILGRHRG